MAERDFISHTCPSDFDCYDRILNARLQFGKQWGSNENICAGATTPENAVKAWMDSAGHRNVILNPDHTYVSIGRHGNLWTADFTFILRE
jgi:uncharacterized protein YkwD